MVKKPAVSSTKKSVSDSPKSKNTNTNAFTNAASSIRKVYRKMREMPLIAAVVAEFIGTFLLVAAIFAVQAQPLYVAFIVAGIVLTIGAASGAFINPAMTIGAWVTGKISHIKALLFTLAQIFGALVSWLTLNAFMKAAVETSSEYGPKLYHAATVADEKAMIIFFAEVLGAAILAIGFAASLKAKRSSTKAAFSYGFATLIALLVAGWVTAMLLTEANTGLTFLNPAVAIAAEGVSFKLWPIMNFVIAPILGGIIGFVLADIPKLENN